VAPTCPLASRASDHGQAAVQSGSVSHWIGADEQLPAPVHAMSHVVPAPQHWMPNWQLLSPLHAVVQDDVGPQSIGPHALKPMQSIVHGPAPQSAPKKQLRSPMQSIAHDAASVQSILLLQDCRASHVTWHGNPGGHRISVLVASRSSPRMLQVPPAQPIVQIDGQTSASLAPSAPGPSPGGAPSPPTSPLSGVAPSPVTSTDS